MKRSDIKQILVAFCVVLILSLSYLFFLYMYRLSTTKEYDPNDLKINYKGVNSVEIKDTLPISDKMGKTIDVSDINDGIEGYIEFSIQNKADVPVNYEIYVLRNDVQNEIDVRYIKMYLSDGEGNPLGIYKKSFSPTYYSLKYLPDMPNAKSIYKGSLKENSKQNFIFRAWVSDGYSFHKTENTFNFSLGVRPI